MRNHFARVFFELALDDPRLCVVVADISPAGSIAEFRERFPERFVNTGVAEQIMIGMVAGMAQRGLRPFAYTIATFALYRPFEMIRDDLCYQNLPVTVVGIGGGIAYSTLGATHHAQEDVALASTVPGLSIVAPCDPLEVAAATRWCARREGGPVYLRLGKAGEPTLTADAPEPWEFGRLRTIRPGRDVCVLAYGSIMTMAIEVADRLEAAGRSVRVVSVHTVKPLDRAGLEAVLTEFGQVVVIEECVPTGGLGMRVKAIAWEIGARCRIDAFALDDAFHHAYGGHVELLAIHGLSAERIVAAVGR